MVVQHVKRENKEKNLKVMGNISKITGPFPSGFRPFLFSGPSGPFRYHFPAASRQLLKLLHLSELLI
jgi:hypothetical protein